MTKRVTNRKGQKKRGGGKREERNAFNGESNKEGKGKRGNVTKSERND